MAKYKITLKRDAALSSDGVQIAEEVKREAIVEAKWCTEAVMNATKANCGFYPIAWECIKPDVKTPEELAEEAKNRAIVEAWKRREAEKLAAEAKHEEQVSEGNAD